MNGKGIFCFLLLLAFVAAQLAFLSESTEARHEMLAAKAIAFEAEKTSFVRTAIENNMDALIAESLRQGLALNLQADEIKQSVNRKLAQLFTETEKAYCREVKVSFGSSQGPVDEQFLNENSVVLISRIEQKTLAADYSFTGGLLKDNPLFAEIAGRKTRQFFRIPIGYTVTTTVVG